MSDQPRVHFGNIVSADKVIQEELARRLKDIAVDREASRLHVGETDPKSFGEYPGISQAILDGATLHAFRSGGGLRVVRLEKGVKPGARGDTLLGYGEHPYIEQAFDHCEEDFRAGKRNYSDVYGKIHQNFLTGCSTPSSIIDRWVLVGRDLDIFANGGLFTFKGKYSVNAIPKEVTDRVAETSKAETYLDGRGFVFDISPSTFANGDKGSSAKVIFTPTKRNSDFAYDYEKPVLLMAPTMGDLLIKMAEEFPVTFERV